MKNHVSKVLSLILILAFLLPACSNAAGNTPTIEPTDTLPPQDIPIDTTYAPDSSQATRDYLDAWAVGDHTAMYNMLTPLSQDAIDVYAFVDFYEDIQREMGLANVDYEILQVLTNPTSASVSFTLTLTSSLIGDITREILMSLSLENGEWRVLWTPTLVLPELADGNYLILSTFAPARGLIYDNDGDVLVGDAQAYAVSVIPSGIEEGQEDGLLAQLATLTRLPIAYLESIIFQEDPPWLVPIAVVPGDQFNLRFPYLQPYGNAISYVEYGTELEPTRLFYNGNAGGHVLGYFSQIQEQELEYYLDLGYRGDEFVGHGGLEEWGELFLAGQHGAELWVYSQAGTPIALLGSRESSPSQSITTTLDSNLQFHAQLAIRDFTGAVVVLERDTGRVLAIASSPVYDPNDADFRNPISEWANYFNNVYDQPFVNRATQSAYPPGSIFKVITLSAALESGLYTRDSSLYCGHTWEGLEGWVGYDWTYDKELPASGELSILSGLMRSCNPWFYEIGLSLYNNDFPTLVSDMARGFGLGSLTGIAELPEVAGQIVNPNDVSAGGSPQFHSIQQAIGQSETLITPLQAAVYIAAVGNGGTLYQPQLIQQIENPDGIVIQEFSPIANGTLPISQETLLAVQNGLRLVTTNPRGTAYRTFANLTIPVYGKTGTAQNSFGDAHAWFIGYTNVNNPNRPDIAIAVLIENIGDGSEFAAPIFRRVMEVYFFGSPQRRYSWETQIGVLNPVYFLSEEEQALLEEENQEDN